MARHRSGCVALLLVALAGVSCQSSSPAVGQPPPRTAAVAPAAANPPAARPGASETPGQSSRLPAIREFDLATLAFLGREIYRQDQLAWHATDAVLEAVGREALTAGSPRGWVVDVSGPEPLVRFLRATPTGVEASYDVHCPVIGRPIVQTPSDRRLAPSQLLHYEALQTAKRALIDGRQPLWRGAGTYNTVVLDDPTGRGLLVYFLRPTVETQVIPVGGHYRISVSADGRAATQVDRLFVSFLSVDRRQIPAGGTPEAIMVSTLVSNTPLETHVFLSLQEKTPFFVLTPDHKVWEVANGAIKLSDAQLPAAAEPPPDK